MQSFPRGFAWHIARQVRHGSTHSRLAQFLRSARGMRERAGGGASSDRVGRTRSESQSSCRHKTPPCQSRSTSERSQCGTAKGARHAASLFRRMVGRPRRDRGRERQAARLEARDLRELRGAAAGRGRDRIDPLTRRAPSLETIERGSTQLRESTERRAHVPSAGQFTIQGMPNLSTHMPKPLAQNVLAKGMVTVPPSASALNLRSPSAGSMTVSEIEKPCGL